MQKYEEAVGDLLKVSILLARWGDAEQQQQIRHIVFGLAGNIEIKGGVSVLRALRWYPMLLVMYAGGIGALDGDNYASLASLFKTQVRQDRRGEASTVLEGTVEALLDMDRDDAFKQIPEFERMYTPSSEYLFKRMQPILEDMLSLGPRYEDLFDRFEVFFALCYADFRNHNWGHPGRFAWKYKNAVSGQNPFGEVLAEARREGGKWAPLRTGLFSGSYVRFDEIAGRLTDLLDGLPWR